MNIITYITLVLGFVCLIKGADFLVDGCVTVASKLRVPSLIIGLTIVAFGTSCPELAVSTTASLNNQNAMAYANVIGSNIFNLLVVVGSSAAIMPFVVKKSMLMIETPISLALAVLLVLFTVGALTGGDAAVDRVEGILLVILFIAFIIYMIISALKNRTEGSTESGKQYTPLTAVVFIVGGLIGIVIGGNLVVDSASDIAANFGMSENLIGLTIVALGTSLPELVTSVVAAKKGESDLALGNAIGSNIFNILMVLGVAAAISPVAVEIQAVTDTMFLIVATIIVWLLTWRKTSVGRKQGIFMVLLYAIYMIYACIR